MATNKKMDTEGVFQRYDPKAIDGDDVEGHVISSKAPEGVISSKGPEGVISSKATDDDVEGHMIGTMNPVLARDLARAKEADIRRATSRNNLVNDTKKSDPRKG